MRTAGQISGATLTAGMARDYAAEHLPRGAGMKRFTRAATLAATLILLAAVASAQQEVPYTYQGTVHAVKPSSVDLIIGVGYALRLVHLRTLPSTRIFSEGAPGAT